MSEKFTSNNPYAYVMNRPTVAVDPDGKEIIHPFFQVFAKPRPVVSSVHNA